MKAKKILLICLLILITLFLVKDLYCIKLCLKTNSLHRERCCPYLEPFKNHNYTQSRKLKSSTQCYQTPTSMDPLIQKLLNKFMLNFNSICNITMDKQKWDKSKIPSVLDINNNRGPLLFSLFDEKVINKENRPWLLNYEHDEGYKTFSISGSIASIFMFYTNKKLQTFYDVLCSLCIKNNLKTGIIFNTNKLNMDVLCTYLSDAGTDNIGNITALTKSGCNCPQEGVIGEQLSEFYKAYNLNVSGNTCANQLKSYQTITNGYDKIQSLLTIDPNINKTLKPDMQYNEVIINIKPNQKDCSFDKCQVIKGVGQPIEPELYQEYSNEIMYYSTYDPCIEDDKRIIPLNKKVNILSEKKNSLLPSEKQEKAKLKEEISKIRQEIATYCQEDIKQDWYKKKEEYIEDEKKTLSELQQKINMKRIPLYPKDVVDCFFYIVSKDTNKSTSIDEINTLKKEVDDFNTLYNTHKQIVKINIDLPILNSDNTISTNNINKLFQLDTTSI